MILGFSADNQMLYLQENISEDTATIQQLDTQTGEQTLLFRHPVVDAGVFIQSYFGKNGKTIRVPVGAITYHGRPKVTFFDETTPFAKQFRQLEYTFPNDWIRITSQTKDNQKWIIKTISDVNPGQFYLYNTQTNKISFIAAAKPWIDTSKMSPKQPISFTAHDGQPIHGFLTIPKGKKAKNLPLIIHPHGGPHGILDTWFFSPEVQVYASAGYAVLQINFRGSGGYGAKFQHSGYGRWGSLKNLIYTNALLVMSVYTICR